MNKILLVAIRDYRQMAAARSFRITLLLLPLIFGISIGAQWFLRPPSSAAYVLVDASGSYGAPVVRQVELEYQRQVLTDLATYAQRWKVFMADPKAAWAVPQGWYSDAQVNAFIAAGGAEGARAKMAPLLPADAPAFSPAPRPFVQVAAPADVPADQGGDSFAAMMVPHLQDSVVTPSGKLPMALAIYIPKNFGNPGVAVRMWTTGRASTALIDTVRDELTEALKLRAFAARGVAGGDAAQIEAMTAPLDVAQPPAGSGRVQMLIRSAVPLALAYLLLMSAITTGSTMLQGIMEERSNKLLESVLACIHPRDLMFGKLLGLGAIGFTMIAVWTACALGAAWFVPGVAADYLRPSLATLNQPWMIAALIFYFLAGYLMIAMIFLAIGSISNSTQDAQAYLMPVLMALMVPVVLMMGSTLTNPGAQLARVMAWIPLYTPFAMLARLGGGVSPAEVLGTVVLLIVFVALELVALARVFEASLLNTGQPPKLLAFVKLMLRPPAE